MTTFRAIEERISETFEFFNVTLSNISLQRLARLNGIEEFLDSSNVPEPDRDNRPVCPVTDFSRAGGRNGLQEYKKSMQEYLKPVIDVDFSLGSMDYEVLADYWDRKNQSND